MTKKLLKWPWKWPNSKTRQLASTEMEKESYALQPDHPIPSSSSLHQSCKTLSIALFKQAYCNNNLQAIVIAGSPTESELLDAWNEIIFEYASLFKSEDSQYMFELSQKISVLKTTIAQTQYLVYYLQQLFNDTASTDQDAVDQLTFLGYPGQFDIDNPEQFCKDLNRCISLCKTHVFDEEQLSNEYNRLKKTTTGKKQSEEDFDANIMMLSKYQHFPIDEEKVTVYKYAIIFNNYMAEMSVKNINAHAE